MRERFISVSVVYCILPHESRLKSVCTELVYDWSADYDVTITRLRVYGYGRHPESVTVCDSPVQSALKGWEGGRSIFHA